MTKSFEKHIQVSEVVSRIFEIAIRGNSFEINKNASKISSARVAGKSWGISSSNNGNIDDLIKKAESLASKGSNRIELADAELARGEFCIGKEDFDEDEALNFLVDLSNDIRQELDKCFIEGILTYEETERRIKTSDGADALERKITIDLNLSVAIKGVVSIHVGDVGGLKSLEKKFDEIASVIKDKAKAIVKAKYLNPLMKGFKMNTILSKECACAFFHELTHKLEADVISNIDILPGNPDVTVYDDPLSGFGSYNFDDEGVLAKRKTLIENGIVKNLLHTRETAKKLKTIPTGNGRGLFTIPKAFQSNLIVEPGDWSFEEILEETKEGFIAEGLVKAELQDNTIFIYPELCWYVKNKEIVCPAILNYIKIQANTALNKIKCIGYDVFERIGYEKGFSISEKSPSILLEATVG